MSLKRGLFAAIIASMIVPLVPSLASAQAGGAPVTTGSPPGSFPQNKQNEPAVAIDPLNPNIVAAGANDEIDVAPCAGSSCPFTPGVGGWWRVLGLPPQQRAVAQLTLADSRLKFGSQVW